MKHAPQMRSSPYSTNSIKLMTAGRAGTGNHCFGQDNDLLKEKNGERLIYLTGNGSH